MEEQKPKILLAGPWCGEFGWEICRWAPYVRYMATKTGPWDQVVVSIQPGHEILYKDYNPIFIYNESVKHPDGWGDTKHRTPLFPNKVVKYWRKQGKLTILYPNKGAMTVPDKKRKYHMFGHYKKKWGYDLLFHARWTNKGGHHKRDWSLAKWGDLATYFKHKLKMGSIGITGQAKHIHYTDNLLNLSLEELADIVASSRLVIGPSSGPIHFASFCGCPHLVWTDNKKWKSVNGNNRYRYEECWNPFDTKVVVLDDCNWQPQLSDVIKNIKNMLNNN